MECHHSRHRFSFIWRQTVYAMHKCNALPTSSADSLRRGRKGYGKENKNTAKQIKTALFPAGSFVDFPYLHMKYYAILCLSPV